MSGTTTIKCRIISNNRYHVISEKNVLWVMTWSHWLHPFNQWNREIRRKRLRLFVSSRSKSCRRIRSSLLLRRNRKTSDRIVIIKDLSGTLMNVWSSSINCLSVCLKKVFRSSVLTFSIWLIGRKYHRRYTKFLRTSYRLSNLVRPNQTANKSLWVRF